MTDFWAQLPGLVGLVPAVYLLAAGLFGGRILLGVRLDDAGEQRWAGLAQMLALVPLLFLLLLAWHVTQAGWPAHQVLAVWFGNAAWQATLSFWVDALSLPLAVLTAWIGWLVLRFSATYLHREPAFLRYFLILQLFLAGMQLVLLAGNALLAFVGWELCGLSSFLLIAYARHRPAATGNALYAFITNRVGDAGFLFGLGLAAYWLHGFEWPQLLAGELPQLAQRVLLLGFVAAALVKSAQWPFSAWIGRALEGPTPSSAIFYGAVMVHAGIYLLLRLSPVIAQFPDIQWILLAIGALTVGHAWLCGLVQSDVKSALVFATLLQLGLMVMAIALGWTLLAQIHCLLHAAWRAWQFLTAPSWLTVSEPPRPAPAWLRQRMAWYVAAQQRFWLDRLALILFARPTLAIAQDLVRLEQRVIDRLLGQPGQSRALDAARPLVRVAGLVGQGLGRLSELLQQIESRLLLEGHGGRLGRSLQQLGEALRGAEQLLEQPRYLMMAVMATFVVIL